MVSVSAITALATTLVALSSIGVDAHGYIAKPQGTFVAGKSYETSPSGLIDTPSVLPSGDYNYNQGPEKNTATFTAAFKASKYKTLKDLIVAENKPSAGATTECGFFDPNGAKQPLPDQVEFGPNDGFSESHWGPCEVWCDDVQAFQDDNCAVNFKTKPTAKLPYDKSKCEGKSRLTIYWLALHTAPGQVYVDCVPLEGGSSTGAASATGSYSSGSNATAPATTTTPTTTTAHPTTTPSTSTYAAPSSKAGSLASDVKSSSKGSSSGSSKAAKKTKCGAKMRHN